MDKRKVLFISQEIEPYLPTSEVAKISRYLPQAMQELGRDIRAFMPKFGCINERKNQLHEVIRLSGMNLIVDDVDHPLVIKVASIQPVRMQVYFIDNEDYFQRKYTHVDENGEEYKDNDERSIFFARGVLETIKKLRWTPDIIHCHGWMSAVVPLYIKRAYCDDPFFENSKIVYSVYNDEFKQPFPGNFYDKLYIGGVDKDELKQFSQPTFEELSKFAVSFSDGVIQASPEVNENILSFAKDKGVPVLSYAGEETYAEKYDEFYDSLFE